MSEDAENIGKPTPDLSRDHIPSKKKRQWQPLTINAIIFGVYSFLILASALIFRNHKPESVLSSEVILYSFLIGSQTFFNFLLFIVFLFINVKKAALFLLSGIIVLLIGFSVCGGISDWGIIR